MKHSLFFLRSFIAAVTCSVLLTGCGLFGIHFKLKNPKRAGKYPAFTQAERLRGELTPVRSCYDVKHYSLNIAVDIEKKFLKGYVDIHAAATAAFDSLQLDLYPELKINFIEYKGQQLSYHRKEGAVFVKMPAKMNTGDKFVLRVDYEGMPIVARKPPWDGGFVWKKDKNDKPWVGVACEGLGASLWWPCKDHLSDEPDSTAINITVPSGLMCVSNGRLRDSLNTGAQTTYKWFVSYPINTYNITLYIGELQLLHDTYVSKITGQTLDLNHYVLPYNYEKARTHFQQLKKHLAFYEKYFGEYPWYRDGYKLVESPYAGMEHQSAIAYGNGYKNGFNGFDYIVLHETAHEWWGNSVTNSDYSDIWIHEGFATYCEALYVEQDQGYNAYISYLLNERIFIRNKRPVVGPTGVNYFNYKDSDPYVKGAWVLHSLRGTINDDPLFLDILKTFRMAYHEKQVTSQDFIDIVNSKTGKDYTWFFKQYLYERKVPVLQYRYEDNILYYRWTGTVGDFKMPVKVYLRGDHPEISKTIYPTTQEGKIELPFSKGDSFYIGTDSGLFIADEVPLWKML